MQAAPCSGRVRPVRLARGRNAPGALRWAGCAGLLGAAAGLCACTQQPVADVGNGRYALVAVSASGGYAGSHEEAIERANDYCGRFHQQAVIDGFDDRPQVGPQGEHTSSVVFICAAPRALRF